MAVKRTLFLVLLTAFSVNSLIAYTPASDCKPTREYTKEIEDFVGDNCGAKINLLSLSDKRLMLRVFLDSLEDSSGLLVECTKERSFFQETRQSCRVFPWIINKGMVEIFEGKYKETGEYLLRKLHLVLTDGIVFFNILYEANQARINAFQLHEQWHKLSNRNKQLVIEEYVRTENNAVKRKEEMLKLIAETEEAEKRYSAF